MGCHIHLTRDCIFKIYPLVICYIAIEHGHRNSVFFSPITVIALCFTMVMLVYQRVTSHTHIYIDIHTYILYIHIFTYIYIYIYMYIYQDIDDILTHSWFPCHQDHLQRWLDVGRRGEGTSITSGALSHQKWGELPSGFIKHGKGKIPYEWRVSS